MTSKTKMFLETLPILNDSVKSNSVLIIPNGSKHDSGFETMTYVVTDIETKKQYKTHGCSDVLGFYNTEGWSIDCVPEYHAIRLWRSSPFTFIPRYSSAEIKEINGDD